MSCMALQPNVSTLTMFTQSNVESGFACLVTDNDIDLYLTNVSSSHTLICSVHLFTREGGELSLQIMVWWEEITFIAPKFWAVSATIVQGRKNKQRQGD